MSDSVIKVCSLGKQYRIGGAAKPYKTIRESITDTVMSPLRKIRQGFQTTDGDDTANSFWALKDVNFEVNRGEVVGIIGRNGAGKSTLLKILSRITEPTEGQVEIDGRVGSLLEVGTGFHPELTGRENIYLNGAILGMKRAEVARKFDEIVAFAETEKFLDTPVKFYSSGMYTRLAFAVAAHLEPEILIVDEVLAVGDAQFQKKCMGKMGEVAKHGRTVLFVSHNMTAVSGLCSRVIWLSNGRVCMSGPSARIVSEYLSKGAALGAEQVWESGSEPGNDEVKLRRVAVAPMDPSTGDLITVDTPIQLDVEYLNLSPSARLNVSVVVSTVEGVAIFNTVSQPDVFSRGLIHCGFKIPGGFLNDGPHYVRVLIVRDEATVLLDLQDAVRFDVQDIQRGGAWHGKWLGATRPRFDWTVTHEHAALEQGAA
jgi:lipopolysaccharide transport system ATP-binding protein